MRLLGIPLGFSPIRPLSWAPMGLKYLSMETRQEPSASRTSRRISSIIRFVAPYGLFVERGISSVRGGSFAAPYTVADELNTIVLTPCFAIASSRETVPDTLLR